MCAERDETPGAMMRYLMPQELKAWSGRKARKDEVLDEQLLARLRLRVAASWSKASSWEEFVHSLAKDDLILNPAGGGLCYHSRKDGKRLAKASNAEPSYSEMIRRYKCGFPGHPHPQIAERVLLRDHQLALLDD